MKLLPVLFLLFSFSAFAGDYYSQRALELKQQYAIDNAIRADKTRRYNMEQLRSAPRNETSDERWERNSREMDDYYHAIQ